MASSTARSIFRLLRIRVRRAQWCRLSRRHFASDTPANPAFPQLRDEMLNRTLPALFDVPTRHQAHKLQSTLSSFAPPAADDYRLLGHHLIYCNAVEPSDELLPDGLDTLHSPGPPFMRRMWAGGSLRLNVDTHYSTGELGWELLKPIVGVERIKDVQTRGRVGGDEKMFVTIERRFARSTALQAQVRKDAKAAAVDYASIDFPTAKADLLRRQAKEDQEWGHATVIEERNLVFMRERSMDEIQAFRAGQMLPARYLEPPGQPEFSHTLTPTPTLLFRYSALTFNAHAIHLDPEYCRNVEGYRNMLVHGPLLLTLMLKLVEAHLQSLTGPPHVIQSIEYRNFTPLYCGEEMRLCGREKNSPNTEDGRIYEAWIEGPTGDMAVKGTVRTARMPTQVKSSKNDAGESNKASGHSNNFARRSLPERVPITKVVHSFTPHISEFSASKTYSGFGSLVDDGGPLRAERTADARESSDYTRLGSSLESLPPSNQTPTPISLEPLVSRKERRRLRAKKLDLRIASSFPSSYKAREHVLTTNNSKTLGKFKSVRRILAPPSPMQPSVSLHTRDLARRIGLRGIDHAQFIRDLKPLPLVRKYNASEDPTQEEQSAEPISAFQKLGGRVKRINQLVVRVRHPRKHLYKMREGYWQVWENGPVRYKRSYQ